VLDQKHQSLPHYGVYVIGQKWLWVIKTSDQAYRVSMRHVVQPDHSGDAYWKPGYNIFMVGHTHLYPSAHQHLQPSTNLLTLPGCSNSMIRLYHYSGEHSEQYGGNSTPVLSTKVVQSHLQTPVLLHIHHHPFSPPLPTWVGGKADRTLTSRFTYKTLWAHFL